jgi:hypothetical protein
MPQRGQRCFEIQMPQIPPQNAGRDLDENWGANFYFTRILHKFNGIRLEAG